MRVCADADISNAVDKLAERRPIREIGPQRQGIDEAAYQAFKFGKRAARYRGAYDQILLLGVPVEQRIEPGDQGHE